MHLWDKAARSSANDGFVYELHSCSDARPAGRPAPPRDHTLALLARHGITSGAYGTQTGSRDGRLVCLLAHPDRPAREQDWAALRGHADSQTGQSASEANGKPLARAQTAFLEMTDEFSTLTLVR